MYRAGVAMSAMDIENECKLHKGYFYTSLVKHQLGALRAEAHRSAPP